MIKKLFLSVIVLTTILFSQTKKQNELSNSLWLNFEGGGNYYRGDFNKSAIEFYTRAGLDYVFNSYQLGLFGVKLSVGYGAISGKSSRSLNIGDPPRNSSNFVSYSVDSKIGLIYLLNLKSIKPYLSAGAHSNVWIKTLDEQRNNAYEKKQDVIVGYYGELGFKVKLTDGLTLNLSGLFNFPNSDKIDALISSKKDFYLSSLFGFSIYFLSQKDSDKDGVVDKFDRCPDTPLGVQVDHFGCPKIQRKDSDNDGIPDQADECPDTPRGVTVNSKGCPTDEDEDGIPDYLDRCPGTSKGILVNEKGCPLDSDGDGVYDAIDECPDTPVEITVNEKGCPLDSDYDGVYDYIDLCPDTPIGTMVDAKGCPVVIEKFEAPVLVLESIKGFESGSTRLSETAKRELKKFSEVMKKYPDAYWRIEGHTDSQGSYEFNKKLSQQRADAIKNYLISLGFTSDRLIAEGMGESYPIADNKTKEGREKNRRIVITKIK